MQHSGAEPEGSSHDLTPLRTREATSAAIGKRKGGQEESDAAELPAKKKSTTPSRKKKKKRAPPKVKLLNADERRHLLNRIVKEDVLAYVQKVVPSRLFSQLFPARAAFWKCLLPDKIQTLVYSAVSKYITLYQECGKGADKNTELYLKWLQYERTLVCKSLRDTDSIVDADESIDEDTKRTVVTLIMNEVFSGVTQQMAKEIEHPSSTSTYTEELEAVGTSPSDEVSLHRICGWALKSVIDKVSQQSKRQPMEPECVEMLRILHLLKLPNDQKIHLPDAVQYLDRGGLTFMRITLFPWMFAVEERMVLNLNMTSYQRYGEKLFEVSSSTKRNVHVKQYSLANNIY